ncbi:MAG: TetR family transcriptional regulator C-terminal domain-containing protein [Oscillospiraceae bacterium]|nr:TetR family transcriptional regulator C-terminal domain-containing protein [Oscillospiraceae bacterium]
MNTEDRRVRKTEKALQNALSELMLHKDLRHITVQELADAADIHRVTFYSHYHDVYDLYEQIVKRVLAELGEIVKEDPAHLYSNTYEAIINYLYNNQTLFYMLLCNDIDNTFISRVCNLLEKKYLDIWLFEDNLSVVSDEMRLLTSYHIHGCIALLTMWARNDFSASKQEITQLLRRTDLNFERMLSNHLD